MKFKIVNKSNSLNYQQLRPILSSFLNYATKHMGINKPPSLCFISDKDNAQLPLGRTAHYDPANMKITIYTDQRHPKDILRSLSHELVHHKQNCNGEFDKMSETGEGYAQSNKHLRSMEEEAYLEGNMCFRDFEDTHRKQLQESNYYFRGDKKMKLFEWKNAEMASMIRERFNIPEAKAEETDAEMGHIKEESGEEEGEHYEKDEMSDEDHIEAIEKHLKALKKDHDFDEEHVDETVSSREGPRNRKTGENTNLRPMEEDAMPMEDEPKGKDLNKDGKKGHGKVPAFLDEAKVRKAVREALKQFNKR